MKIASRSSETHGHTDTQKKKLNPRQIHQDFLDSLEDDLSEKGVIFYTPDANLNIDEEYLVLPREITEVTSRDLGEYLNAFTQQKVYMRTLLGRAELLEEDSRRKYFASTEGLYHQYSDTKLSETAKDRLINSDEEVMPFFEEYKNAKSRVSLLKSSIENIEDIIFLLSREVTRRNSDFDTEARNNNVNTRRGY